MWINRIKPSRSLQVKKRKRLCQIPFISVRHKLRLNFEGFYKQMELVTLILQIITDIHLYILLLAFIYKYVHMLIG